MDFVAAKAKVGGGSGVGVLNTACVASQPLDLSAFLRCVVFLCQPHFGAGADGQSVRLRPAEIPLSYVIL